MRIIKHPNGVFYAHYQSASGPVQLSLKTKDKAEAAALARDAKIERIEHLAKANALTQEAITRAVASRRVTGANALPAWSAWAETVGLQPNTRDQYALQIGAFLRDTGLAAKPVSTITDAAINEWVNAGNTLASRMARMKALKSFCSVLSAKGLIAGSPAAAVRIRHHDMTHAQKESEPRQPFTSEEVNFLMNGLPPDWAAMSALSLATGFRLGDCAAIEHACFLDKDRSAVAIWMGKVDKRIALPLPAPVRRRLDQVQEEHPRFVFPKFAEMAGDVKRRAMLSTYFKRHAERAGVTGKTFHSFRHTFATERARLGDTVDEIRLKLGHELADTTRLYVHVE